MSRRRGRPRTNQGEHMELEGIPGTAPGMGLRVSRRTRLMGIMGLGNGLPRPVEEVLAQATLVEVPSSCARCGSAAIMLGRDVAEYGPPRRVSCFMCGWDAFLVLPPLAPVVGCVEIERRGGVVNAEAPRVRSARPRRRDRRKRPTHVPEAPPKYEEPLGRYVYEPEKPLPSEFRPNGGVKIF